nr:photosystem I P700 apoprotein A1 [Valeriana jatamansi]UYF12388.1 photosystem I P700 apoprotein A1 [Valeriana jatamansi]
MVHIPDWAHPCRNRMK